MYPILKKQLAMLSSKLLMYFSTCCRCGHCTQSSCHLSSSINFFDVVVAIVLDEPVVLNLLGNVVVDIIVEFVCLNVFCCWLFLMLLFHYYLLRLLSKTLFLTFLYANFGLSSSMLTMLLWMFSCLLFCLMLSTMSMLTSSRSILLMSGLVVQAVVVHIFIANFLLNNFSLSMLLLAFCNSFVYLDDVIVLLPVVVPFFCCQAVCSSISIPDVAVVQ